MHLRLLLAIIFLSLGGCIVNTDNLVYPDAWPKQTHSYDIENQLEGSFSCAGLVTEDRFMKRLPDFLDEESNPWEGRSLGCSRVEIQRVTDGFEIRYIHKESIIKKQIYVKSQDYKIEDSWIKLDSFQTSVWNAESLYTVSSYLTVNSRGDFIIRAQISSLTFLLIIPIGVDTTHWGMFKRTSATNAAECEMSVAVNDAIWAAQTASNKIGRPPDIQNLIYEAGLASRPPVCDDFTAKNLADKAYRLATELSQ